jgi:hypothetical protein
LAAGKDLGAAIQSGLEAGVVGGATSGAVQGITSAVKQATAPDPYTVQADYSLSSGGGEGLVLKQPGTSYGLQANIPTTGTGGDQYTVTPNYDIAASTGEPGLKATASPAFVGGSGYTLPSGAQKLLGQAIGSGLQSALFGGGGYGGATAPTAPTGTPSQTSYLGTSLATGAGAPITGTSVGLGASTPPGEVKGEESGKPRQNVWNEASLRLKDALGV